jgi:hypothetical protein
MMREIAFHASRVDEGINLAQDIGQVGSRSGGDGAAGMFVMRESGQVWVVRRIVVPENKRSVSVLVMILVVGALNLVPTAPFNCFLDDQP